MHLKDALWNTYRYRCVLEYDGSFFAGWQWQKHLEHKTIQGALQEAAYKLTQQKIVFHGAGRTDQGVHALGQVAHIDLLRPWSLESLRMGLNFHLKPSPICVLSVEPVLSTFDARFSALFRRYRYVILNRPSPSALEANRIWWVSFPLDVQAMKEAAGYLQGSHDFSSFRYRDCQAASPCKTLDLLSVNLQDKDRIIITAQARSFLHRQVRMMVGALVHVGKGKWPARHMTEVLKARSASHGAATAPPFGLYLEHVGYEQK